MEAQGRSGRSQPPLWEARARPPARLQFAGVSARLPGFDENARDRLFPAGSRGEGAGGSWLTEKEQRRPA
jgi:hypothetical protein